MAKVLGFSINIEGTERAVETAEELRRAIADVNKELKKTGDVDEIKRLEKELIALKGSQQDVNAQIREEIKLRRIELNAVDDASGSYDKLSRTLNEQRKRYKDLAAAGKQFTNEAIDIRTEITTLDQRLKQIDASVGQFQRNVGGYTEALSQFFPRVTQSIGGVTSGFQAATGASGALNKSLGVILLAVTVFNEVSAALIAAAEAGKEFNEVSKRLQQVSTDTGETLQDNTGTVIALSRTYQQESREIINAANAVAKEFGISFDESLTLIEAGFRKGANAQGDFLDQLREYPAQFAAAGGSAASFVDILIKAQNEGIYSDKGIDAVKEFGLRIREQTKATTTALEGAFGKKFTGELFKGLNDGSITTVDALKRVAGGLRDTQLTAKQTQTVIADVFGGPGEDAGLRFLQLLADVESATDGVTESTNEYESQQYALFEANQQLAQSQARLAEFTVKTGTEFELLKVGLKTFLAEQAADVLKFFNELPATLAGASAALIAFTKTLSFGLLGEGENPFKAYNRAYKEAIKEVRAADEEALLFNEKRKQQEEAAAKDTGKKVGESFAAGSIAAIQKKANELQKAINEAVAGSATQKRLIEAYAKQQKLLEDAIEKRNRFEFQAGRERETQAVQQIKTLTSTLLNIEFDERTQASKRLLDLGKKLNDQRFRTEIKQNQDRLKALTEQEKLEQQQRRDQILAYIQQGVQQTFDLINALTATANQRRNEIFQQQISDTEAKINDLETRAQQATGIRKRFIEQSIAAEKKRLEEQTKAAEAESKRQRKNEKRNSIISSIILGALAVTRALLTGGIPLAIATGIFAALQTATIAAQPLATGGLVGISGRKVNDRQNIRTRGNGDNVLATVKRGEVVLNQRQQSALGGPRTFRSIGVPGFATGGAVSPTIRAPRLPASVSPADSMAAISALDRKTDAINARLDRLRAYVVTDDIARDMADGEAVKIKATL